MKVAHEGRHVDWQQLDQAMDLVGEQLLEWHYVDARPDFGFFAERSALCESAKPHPGPLNHGKREGWDGTAWVILGPGVEAPG